MRILIAPNAYKGSITARDAAEAIAAGLSGHEVRMLPMADGGDGTLDAFDASTYQQIDVVDALRRSHRSVMSVEDGFAVIELARVCGIAGMVKPEPWVASSLGLGLAAQSAIDGGAHTIALALGGSASTDAGIGFLIGLGARVLDRGGFAVAPNLAGLRHVAALDLRAMQGTHVRWRILADTTSTLLGPDGAAHGYGPQKGLTPLACAAAEEAMRHWTHIVDGDAEISGGAAAGGIAWTAAALLGAQIERGSDVIAERQGLDEAMHWADLVITGEGRFDRSSLTGKASGNVISRARGAGTLVAVIAGDLAVTAEEIRDSGVCAAICLIDVCGGAAAAFGHPTAGLTRAAQQLAATLDS